MFITDGLFAALVKPHQASHDPVSRLQCADDAVWNKTVAAVEHEQAAAMARHCRQEICHGNLACAATCLEHVMQVARAEAALDTWLACSTSPACSPSCRYLDIYTIYIFWVSTRYLHYLHGIYTIYLLQHGRRLQCGEAGLQ